MVLYLSGTVYYFFLLICIVGFNIKLDLYSTYNAVRISNNTVVLYCQCCVVAQCVLWYDVFVPCCILQHNLFVTHCFVTWCVLRHDVCYDMMCTTWRVLLQMHCLSCNLYQPCFSSICPYLWAFIMLRRKHTQQCLNHLPNSIHVWCICSVYVCCIFLCLSLVS